MKTATVKEIKQELKLRTPSELQELCLRLSRFKKENKELLTYLLFESADEDAYIVSVKREIDMMFEDINTSSIYFIKKSVRKILRHSKIRIRYSLNKQTEVELLIWFCIKLSKFEPSINNNQAMVNLLNRQIEHIRKTISFLHEDLQYDYGQILEELT